MTRISIGWRLYSDSRYLRREEKCQRFNWISELWTTVQTNLPIRTSSFVMSSYYFCFCVHYRFNQATAMTRHYKKPVLLIEFDENKPFSLQVLEYIVTTYVLWFGTFNWSYYSFLCVFLLFLQAKSSIQSEISSQSISSKLSLLTLHFPNVTTIMIMPSQSF